VPPRKSAFFFIFNYWFSNALANVALFDFAAAFQKKRRRGGEFLNPADTQTLAGRKKNQTLHPCMSFLHSEVQQSAFKFSI